MSGLRLYLSSLFSRKVILVFVFLLPLLAIFLPELTPVSLKPSLIEPARAQAAWVLLWLTTVIWILVEASSTGSRWQRGGIFELLLPASRNRFPKAMLALQINAGLVFPSIVLLIETILISLYLCTPSDSAEARLWSVTNLQYGTLYLIVTAPLCLLAFSLGTRLNPVVSWIIVAAFLIYGLVIQEKFAPFLSGGGIASSLGSLCLPHYHLADLTDRLVFKLGPLPPGVFGQFILYFGGWGIILGVVALTLFRPGR
ncbi:MAG: hypothetical protein P1U81_06595 [Verrucomicrobiales bacterium]|nr:hypothetical protein [Verrucomicrobiales bacterium]